METFSNNFQPKPIALHLGAWAVMAAFFMVTLANTPMPFWEIMALILGNFASLAVLFYGHNWLVNRFWESGLWAKFFIRSLPLLAFDCTARFLICAFFMSKYIRPGFDVLFSPVRRLGLFVFITGFLVTVVAIVFRLLINRTRRERESLALLAEQSAAQLQFLKAQINPHFLFNALHNVHSLTVQKSDDAPKMLLKLSDLLRYAIYDSRFPEVSLAREWAELQKFTDLFQMRFERPVDIRFEVEGSLDGRSIEPMILMPMLENCFKHGNFDSAGQAAFCLVSIKNTPESLFFSTKNSFSPTDQQKDAASGIGLENIRRRLGLRYPGRHRFSFFEKNGVFEVHLTIDF